MLRICISIQLNPELFIYENSLLIKTKNETDVLTLCISTDGYY